MENMTGKKSTFVVQIRNQQNTTWQGTITWVEKGITEHFRSMLELTKLIDSTIRAEIPEIPSEEKE